ncbi:MAG: rod shape-determining protein RodA [Flavobacteriales bacterium]
MSAPRKNILSNVDWITVLLYLALVIFGYLNIYSAALVEDKPNFYDFSQEYGKQFWFIVVSLFVALMILYLEADVFSRFSVIIYGIFLFLLGIVLIPGIGQTQGGNQAWINLGVLKLQPAEFAKIGVALLLAKYISSTKAKFNDWKTRVIAAAIIGIPAVLILLQPDVGSLLTFVAFTFVLYRAGLSGNVLFVGLGAIVLGVISVIAGHATFNYPFYEEKEPTSAIWLAVVIAFILGVLLLAAVRNFVVPRNRTRLYLIIGISTVLSCGFMGSVQYIMSDVFKPHQRSRIYVTFGLEEKKKAEVDQDTGEPILMPPDEKAKDDDPGYNARMAKMAVANGGLLGQGFMQGPMTSNKFVPERWTDFIFSVISEEWGFFGSLSVVILFATLIIRLIFLAERQRSQFSRIYGYGVASIFMIHFIINIGMVIGLAPIIGIPLPFMSYGGSSLLGFTMMLFIMLRLDSERLSIFK